MLNSAEHEVSIAQIKMLKNKDLALKFSDVVFIVLINVKMLSIVGNLTFNNFMSRIDYMIS